MQIGQVQSLKKDQHLNTTLFYGVIWLLGGAKRKVLLPEVVQKLNFIRWLKECVKYSG